MEKSLKLLCLYKEKKTRLLLIYKRYPPNDKLYLKYKDVYQNDLYFEQATGKVNWPNYDGFVPESINYETLREGTQFMRIASCIIQSVESK